MNSKLINFTQSDYFTNPQERNEIYKNYIFSSENNHGRTWEVYDYNSAGQEIKLGADLEKATNDTIHINIWLNIFNKRSDMIDNEDRKLSTGKTPFEDFIKVRKLFDILELTIRCTNPTKKIIMFCWGTDTRRNKAYLRYLSSRGYSQMRNYTGKMVIGKIFKPAETVSIDPKDYKFAGPGTVFAFQKLVNDRPVHNYYISIGENGTYKAIDLSKIEMEDASKLASQGYSI